MNNDYQAFLAKKLKTVQTSGFDVAETGINTDGTHNNLSGLWYNYNNANANERSATNTNARSNQCKGHLQMATSDSAQTTSKRQSYTCEVCGISFERYPSQMKKSKHVYCSQACLAETRKHGSTLYCALCDSPFYRRFGEQDIGHRVNQFCSRNCYQEWRAIHRKDTTYIKIGGKHLHRIVAEQCLGRPLTSDEVVHHIDGNKHNNSPSNLAVLPNQTFHAQVHFGEVSNVELQRFSLK